MTFNPQFVFSPSGETFSFSLNLQLGLGQGIVLRWINYEWEQREQCWEEATAARSLLHRIRSILWGEKLPLVPTHWDVEDWLRWLSWKVWCCVRNQMGHFFFKAVGETLKDKRTGLNSVSFFPLMSLWCRISQTGLTTLTSLYCRPRFSWRSPHYVASVSAVSLF